MTFSIFPSSTALPGVDIHIGRTPAWETIVQQAISGKETRVAKRIYPRRTWELKFNFLRSSTSILEFQTLESFFNNVQGMFTSFLWSDPDDNSSSGQTLAPTDGVASTYQLVRAFGNASGFIDPIYAPNVVGAVYLNGVLTSSTTYSVSAWGSSNPGTITFSSGPPVAGPLSADFTYYWPVRFTADDMTFDKMVNLIWEGKKVSFISLL